MAACENLELSVHGHFDGSLIFCPKIPFYELFSKIIFTSSSDSSFFRNVRKFENAVMRRSTRNFNPLPGKTRAFELLKIGSFKFPPPWAKMVLKCPPYRRICLSNPTKEQLRIRLLSSLQQLLYKHANTCFLTLYMMMPFLPDLSYYKNTTLRLKQLKIELIKDGAYYCYCAYVLRISKYSGSSRYCLPIQ